MIEFDYMLDLFSGIGGFSEGFKRAGWRFKKHYYSEIDKHAIQVYRKQFSGAEHVGSVEDVSKDKIKPGRGVVTFGFPCQDISIAGKRGGLKASRSGLFFKAIKIVDRLQPEYFIFENVKGLFSSNGGKDFLVILQEIADRGYDGQWQLVNTRWVLPQNRERIYFIGYARNGRRPEIFPIGESDCGFTKRSQQTTVNTISGGGHSGGHHSSMTLIQVAQIGEKDAQHSRVYSSDGIAKTISAGGGQGAKTGLYAVLQRPRGNNKGGTKKLPNLTASRCEHNDFLKTGTQIRRLTPVECERLQGFSDNRTSTGIDDNGNEVKISDTQRYRQLGNAVSVPIVELIARKLKNSILEKTDDRND